MIPHLSPRLILSLSLALLCLLTPLLALANSEESPPPEQQITAEEEPEQTSSGFFDQEHRRQIYEASRLTNTRALLYTLALPGLGNFYAEQYALGLVATSAFVFSAFFLTYGLLNNHPDLVWIGAGLATVAYGGGAISSVLGVRSYNERLRQGLHLSSPLPEPPQTFGLSWRWNF